MACDWSVVGRDLSLFSPSLVEPNGPMSRRANLKLGMFYSVFVLQLFISSCTCENFKIKDFLCERTGFPKINRLSVFFFLLVIFEVNYRAARGRRRATAADAGLKHLFCAQARGGGGSCVSMEIERGNERESICRCNTRARVQMLTGSRRQARG